jgi:hypothetical protein
MSAAGAGEGVGVAEGVGVGQEVGGSDVGVDVTSPGKAGVSVGSGIAAVGVGAAPLAHAVSSRRAMIQVFHTVALLRFICFS